MIPHGHNICRLCANQGSNYHSIFDFNDFSIIKKINDCLPIVVKPTDKLPTHICNTCLEALNTSDKLRTRCLLADSILRRELRVVLVESVRDKKHDVEKDKETHTLSTNSKKLDTLLEHIDDNVIVDYTSDVFKNKLNPPSKPHQQENENLENKSKYIEIIELDNDPDESHDFMEISLDPVDIAGEVVLYPEDIAMDMDLFMPNKTPSDCVICNVTIANEDLLGLHLNFHAPRPMYCTRCRRTLPSPYDLYIHKKTVHNVWANTNMLWFCERCEMITDNAVKIKRHLAKCTKPLLQCRHCSREFIHKVKLTCHEKNDHRDIARNIPILKQLEEKDCEKPCKSIDCDNADQSQIQYVNSTSSVGAVDLVKRTFQCNLCPMMFHSEVDMWKHKRFMHRDTDVERETQSQGSNFINEPLFGRHFMLSDDVQGVGANQNIDIKERNICCDYCNRIFMNRKDLQEHMDVHVKEQQNKEILTPSPKEIQESEGKTELPRESGPSADLVCEFCGNFFESQSSLVQHKREEHTPPGGNESRDIEYIELQENLDDTDNLMEGILLEDPIDIQHEIVPRTDYIPVSHIKHTYCSICHISLEDKQLMRLHVKFHEFRPLCCDCCVYAASSAYDLYIHQKVGHMKWANFQVKWFCEKCRVFIGDELCLRTHIDHM